MATSCRSWRWVIPHKMCQLTRNVRVIYKTTHKESLMKVCIVLIRTDIEIWHIVTRPDWYKHQNYIVVWSITAMTRNSIILFVVLMFSLILYVYIY